jgi:2,3-bisphosphoglycerate-independent phosphoglycerate mutase
MSDPEAEGAPGAPGRILVLFADGIGVGPSGQTNPFATAALPALSELLDGGRLVAESFEEGVAVQQPDRVVRLLDATLGVAGRPQSGTGQTVLLTGINAPARFGRHFGPWVPTSLRALFEEHGFMRVLSRKGLRVALLSAVPPDAPIGGAGRRPAAAPLAALAAEVPLRSAADLREGRAVAGSFHTQRWRRHDPSLPAMTGEQGAVRLGRLAAEAEVSLFAHYDTDIAGHARSIAAAEEAAEALDRALGALLPALPGGTLCLVCSDHGNLEDATTGHTRNPVPLIAVGPGAEAFAEARSILDISPLIDRLLSAGCRPGRGASENAGGGAT